MEQYEQFLELVKVDLEDLPAWHQLDRPYGQEGEEAAIHGSRGDAT